MKIVINACFGGFSVSENFLKEYNIPYEKSKWGSIYPKEGEDIDYRTDPRLIEYIEKHGSEMASGSSSYLVVEEIPKGTAFMIDEYDGNESIMYRDEMSWMIAT